MSKFVVMGIQRTGTILLCSTLNQHPDILSLDELFVNHHRYKPGVIHPYRNFVVETGKSNTPKLLNHKRTIFKYLDHFYSLPDCQAKGFKLMANQANHLTYIQKFLKKRKVKIIKIVRENVFRTYLSRFRAIQTGLYHSSQRRIAEDIPILSQTRITLPVDTLEKELETMEKENLHLNKIVDSIKTPKFSVGYESLANDFSVSINRILSFLDVNSNIEIKPARKKISPLRLEDSIENYKDVRIKLAGTRFEQFLG